MKVFYTERLVANSESFSPSAHKPREVMESWQTLGLPAEIVEPEAVTIDQFALAHDRSFAEDVLLAQRQSLAQALTKLRASNTDSPSQR